MRVFGAFLALLSATWLATPALCATHPFPYGRWTITAAVKGHAGNSTPAMSMEISRLRARNVADDLVNNLGIARSRVSSEGFGKADGSPTTPALKASGKTAGSPSS